MNQPRILEEVQGEQTMVKAIRLNVRDQVATVLGDATSGEDIKVYSQDMEKLTEVKALQKIPFGNKVALEDIEKDITLYKGGYPIGYVVKNIKAGDLVHVQNVRSSHIDIPEGIIGEIIKQMDIREEI